MPSSESDVRTSALKACRAVGLYPDLALAQFLERHCAELVVGAEAKCPLDPGGYTDGLLKFREIFRAELEARGHAGFKVYLQRLCDQEATGQPAKWTHWCRYHADQI